MYVSKYSWVSRAPASYDKLPNLETQTTRTISLNSFLGNLETINET